MPPSLDPRMLRIQLGIELRRLREKADRSTFEAADVLGCKQPKISKIENGHQGMKPDEVAQLLDFYGASAQQRKYLLGLAERLPKRARPKVYHRDSVPDWVQRFFALESEATEMKIHEVEIITGLFQTEDYARATLRAWEPAADPRLVESHVKTRMERQTVLTRTNRPLDLQVVLAESALHRVQGSNDVMREQLDHLLELSELPNVRLQVLPFESSRIAVTSSVALMHLADQQVSTVYLEDFFGATYLWEPAEYTRYSVIFERLSTAALSVPETRQLIARMIKKYR
ncbi:helix-turn-helix transcriptional regulator [Saccharopolyspora spinosa]|uniref:Helix-turn-helix protein n=2 Tax=Saccharopolyspora spinosa TaxID=60894 RepID=A0A2N3XYF5_SACSN|nr:helix-turn-helix transcriptional regulator [Saccharopolyspora spinosa]PKW15659.1 helix-turn-helix protein [Saccharopolyspora spinosa]